MVQRKDEFSTGGDIDRIERLERIVAILSSGLLGEWLERTSPGLRRGRRRGYERDELSYGPLNGFLDKLLYDLAGLPERYGRKRLPDLYNIEQSLREHAATNQKLSEGLSKEMHELVYLLHAGIDPNSVRGRKFIPVRIYTSEEDYKIVAPIERALLKVLEEHGFKIDDHFPPVRGSWFKKMIGRTKEVASSDEVRESLKKVKHGIELQTLQKGQAEVNKANASAVKELMEAMSQTENAACSVGSILIIKVSKDGNSNVFTKTMTQNEMIAIEDNQQISMDPATVLEKLANLCNSDGAPPVPYVLTDEAL